MKYDAVIIGSGIAGLTCASLLAKRGVKICLVEGQYKPGGSCGIFKRQDDTFEQGVAMFFGFKSTGFSPHNFVFNQLEQDIDMVKHKNLYTINYLGRDIVFYEDIERFTDQLGTLFPRERNSLKKFYKDMSTLYQYAIADRPTFTTPDTMNMFEGMTQLFSHPVAKAKFLSYMNLSTYDLLKKYFRDPAIFQFFDKLTSTYCYTNVRETPAILSAVMFVDNHFGGSYYPQGTTLQLLGKMEKVIEENEGDCYYSHKVREILVENNKAIGIVLDNYETILGDHIVYSGTVWNLYEELLNKKIAEKERAHAKGLRPTASSVVLYGVVKKSAVPESADAIKMIVGNATTLDESEITVYFNSKEYNIHCPEDCHSFTAIGPTLANWKNAKGAEYEACKVIERNRMVEAIDQVFPGFAKALVYSEVGTPRSIERYTYKNNGSVAGPMQCMGQHMLNRPHTQHSIEGLYLCGESTVMGTGSTAVTISGIAAANLILQGQGKPIYKANKDANRYVHFEKRQQYAEGLSKKAWRCQYCENAPCQKACPSGIDICGINRRVAVDNRVGARKLIPNDHPCTTCKEKYCENACIKKKFSKEPVEISNIIYNLQ